MKRKQYSPGIYEKTSRHISPLGLSIDPRLLDEYSDLDSTQLSSLSNSIMENSNGIPRPLFYSTPPAAPRPTFDPNAPTRPAFALNLPDQAAFAALPDSQKLNWLFIQNNAIIASQNFTQDLLVRMLQNQEAQMKTIADQVQLQQQSMGLLQNQLASINRYSLASAFIELQEDKEERALKKDNAVLFGLAEHKEGDKSDMEVIQAAFIAADADPAVITDVFRLGQQREAGAKPRPIKILTSSFDDKMKLLKSQKKIFAAVPDFKLRGDGPFFRHDQSKMQRESDFQLRNELRQMRQRNPGTQFVVSGGKIIVRSGNAPPPM